MRFIYTTYLLLLCCPHWHVTKQIYAVWQQDFKLGLLTKAMPTKAKNGQHQITNMQKFRSAISASLYAFVRKMDSNTAITSSYCDDMAYTGTSDSRIFKKLP